MFISCLPLSAQDSKEDILPKIHKTAETARKQIPSDKAAAAEQAEFIAKNVPAAPLPAGSKNLDVLRARAAAIQKQHAQYLADIASGKINPYAHLIEARPKLIEDHKDLTLALREINSEEVKNDPYKKQLLFKAFFAALQPVGPYLEIADPGEGYANILSKDQQAELTRLESAWDAADKACNTTNKPLQIIGPGQLYAITNLSVPITVQAPPSSKVIFQTFGGGFFTNKLAFIEVETSDEGIATTEWVSYGDSIGDAPIGVRCKDAAPAANLNITTVQLKLSALPVMPAKVPAIPSTKIPPVQIPAQ